MTDHDEEDPYVDQPDEYQPLVFADAELQRRYLAMREQSARGLLYPIGKIPQHEREKWAQARDAFRARMAEVEAMRAQQPPAGEVPQ